MVSNLTRLQSPARRLTGPAILLLAAYLRFYGLGEQSLWADEGNSVALARRGFAEIAQRTAFDIHPPLYYWLLKVWIIPFDDGEAGLRSLSAVLAVGVVYLIWVLGTHLFSARAGLIAAFIAALSPLQIYYAQEARMYMLLTFLSTLTVLITLLLIKNHLPRLPRFGDFSALSIGYVVTVTAALYTHYAYPLILAVVNIVVLLWFWGGPSYPEPHPHPQSLFLREKGAKLPARNPLLRAGSPLLNPQGEEPGPALGVGQGVRAIPAFFHWCLLQLIPLLIYLPWLPTAWRQVTTWPSEQQPVTLPDILAEISTTLLFGLAWPFEAGPVIVISLTLVLAGALIVGVRQIRQALPQQWWPAWLPLVLLGLWAITPILLTIIIFSPAFLKFLLIATPPLSLLLALLLDGLMPHSSQTTHDAARNTHYGVPLLLLTTLCALSLLSLNAYYTDPRYARDNYRAIAYFIKAVGSADDAVILTAEGQQDVFNYYFDQPPTVAAPVYPLPQQRPLDETATLALLEQLRDDHQRIYAVYWATQQADPNGLIEEWLDNHLFKATDQWYGNVRLVSYATPKPLEMTTTEVQLGDTIQLTGFSLSDTTVIPGEILQVALSWLTTAPLPQNYTVFIQLLDAAGHLVGQRDAQPLIPTTSWSPDQAIADAHGVFIEPGTPPGRHRLIVGLYDTQTGQRLSVVSDGDETPQDFVELAQIEIEKPARPLPVEGFTIQHPLNVAMLEIDLLGYDFYKAGHRSTPDTPLRSGDPVQLVIYWRVHQPVYWLNDKLFIQVVGWGGRTLYQTLTRTPAGVDYEVSRWQPGEIVRAQHSFFLTDLPPGRYYLAFTVTNRVGGQRIVALSQPFWVE